MGDLLSTSVSGLLAFQRALDVTSNNVANAATPGYSVERAELTTQPAQATSAGYIGGGVQVATVSRSYDELLAQQVRSSQSGYSSFNTFATQAAQVDNMLSDSSTGLTVSLQNFVNALQNVANSPASTSQRQVLLSQAQALAQQLQTYDSQLTQYGANVESQIGTTVSQINTIAGNIATVNQQIAAAESGTGQAPNDLLDQRDQLLDQLSQYVTVNTATQSDGQMNVYIGSGQALVTGSVAQQLKTITDPYDPTRADVGLVSGSTTADVTSEISGGTLGGLLSVRSQVIDAAQNSLGQISVGLASIVNQQQQAGMDLNGAQGQPMFAVGGVGTLPDVNNTGSAALTVTRTNLGALTTDNYQMRMNAGSWQLLDTTTGQSVTMTGAGTAANPYQAAGMSIVVSGAAANGDSFELQPTAAATAGLSVLLTSPSQIAAATLVQSAAAGANTGTATISGPTVTDPTNPQLLSTATIQFLSPTQYQINGSGSYTYTSGAPISANGWSVSISGTPAAGDTFSVASNVGGVGDNSNALATIAALSAGSLNGGTTSLSGAANNLIGQVGVVTQQAQANATAQQSVNASAVDARNNLSGVNLDEEAANLVRYQQAYSAAAQMIQTSNALFNTLLTAVSRG
jgi:flagellar hook-associated protein 1 FlgK